MIFIDRTSEQVDEVLINLVQKVKQGQKKALETLIHKLQPLVYNLCQKFYLNPMDAEDASQEILVKIATNLSTWELEKGSLKTWVMTIARNHLIDFRRKIGRLEQQITGIEDYFGAVDIIPDDHIADTLTPSPEEKALAMEANAGCMLGMLLCLDREQRLILIVGDVLGLDSTEAGKVFGLTSDTFRQRLHRARTELYNFMEQKCGLVNKSNPCRCRKKAKGFVSAGWIDPVRKTWTDQHYNNLEVYSETHAEMAFETVFDTYAKQFRTLPVYNTDKVLLDVGLILEHPEVKKMFRLSHHG